ncbi:MAG: hypothetical protein CSA21_03385 [Deltaproteobacteria bacterium]|nr:MAG: hypothetical protein CSA21_03385 [Deltaproteobacteria bacterium]
MCVDLHIHSTFSDGTLTPTELVRLGCTQKLTAMALTDHDTTAGLNEFIKAADERGMHAITGVEIHAIHGQQYIHLLGYGIDHTDPKLQTWLKRLQQGREQRNLKILEKLAGLGYALDPEELVQLSPVGQTGRPHIARLLVKQGLCPDMQQAFYRLLGQGKPAYVSRFVYSAVETIAVIHQYGGLAVLAHPGQIDSGYRKQPRLIAELALRGLDGIELYHPSHRKKMRKKLGETARHHALLTTGGSDFHGSNRPKNRLAAAGSTCCPPDHILDELNQRLRKRRDLSTTT